MTGYKLSPAADSNHILVTVGPVIEQTPTPFQRALNEIRLNAEYLQRNYANCPDAVSAASAIISEIDNIERGLYETDPPQRPLNHFFGKK